MNDAMVIACCALGGGAAGAALNQLTALPRGGSGRRRGEHRPVWRRAPRTDPHADTDVPVGGVPLADAVTQQLPLPGAPGPR